MFKQLPDPKCNICVHILAFLCLLLIFSELQANELLNLDLHDTAFAFIKRLATRDPTIIRLNTTRPISRRELAKSLMKVSEKHELGQIQLTNVEAKRLEQYREFFKDEIAMLRREPTSNGRKFHTFVLKGEDGAVYFDAGTKQEVARVTSDLRDSQNTYINSLEFDLSARLGQHLGVLGTVQGRIIAGSTTYNPYLAESRMDKLTDNSKALNSADGYAVLSFPYLTVLWGLDENWWGPGWHGALMISDNSPSMDNLKITGMVGAFKYTYFTSVLRAEKVTKEADKFRQRYMSAHRLEFSPHCGLNFGLSEVMLFPDRYEWRYLNPFIIYYMAQPEWIADNGIIGFDFDIALIPAVEFYGEFMIDDFQLRHGFPEAFQVWNSQYGALIGGYWVDPFGQMDIDMRMEYAFVNEYAYTHRNEITSYAHKGFVIGHWMGTDADDLWIDAGKWVTDRIRVSLSYERERQGEGDIKEKHPLDVAPGTDKPEDIDPMEHWEFLSGITQSTRSFSIGASYNRIGHYSAGMNYTYSRIKNLDNESGSNGKEHELVIKLDYHF